MRSECRWTGQSGMQIRDGRLRVCGTPAHLAALSATFANYKERPFHLVLLLLLLLWHSHSRPPLIIARQRILRAQMPRIRPKASTRIWVGLPGFCGEINCCFRLMPLLDCGEQILLTESFEWILLCVPTVHRYWGGGVTSKTTEVKLCTYTLFIRPLPYK